eukprot:31442-Pelagococcus_subviridis.AAC.3
MNALPMSAMRPFLSIVMTDTRVNPVSASGSTYTTVSPMSARGSSSSSPRPPGPPPRGSSFEGRSIRANVGVEFKGVRSGVERRRGVSGLKPWDPGRRDATGKVLKERRSPRDRGRVGTSV